MFTRFRLIPFALFLILFSCNKQIETDWEIPYGSWKYLSYDDSVIVYQRTLQFDPDEGGFSIKNDNVFIHRTSGWCGTPPLVFSEIEGSWLELDENYLKVTYMEYENEVEWVMEIVDYSLIELRVINHYDWE